MKSPITSRFSEKILNIEKKLPLEKFIPAAFLIFLLCLFILSTITYQNIERYKNDLDWINHSNEVLKEIDDIQIILVEIALIRRGFMLTGEEHYLLKVDSLINIVRKEFIYLKNLIVDDPLQQKLVNSLDSLSEQNISIIKSSILDTIVFEPVSLKFSAKQINATNEAHKNLEKIDEIANEFKFNELALLKNRSDNADRTNSTIQIFIITTGLFSFMVIGLSLFISDRLIKNKTKAENLLMESYEDLEDRVDERTLELRDSTEKLEEEIIVRKRTEETLRESEHRFQLMADSAPVLIWISGKDKSFTYFNKAWLDFTGRTMAQESGIGWTEGVHPDDLKKCLDVYVNAFNKRVSFEMEFRLRNSIGEYVWVLDKGIPRYKGTEYEGFIGSCIDINERKKNERFLKIQYAISKTLAESDSVEEVSTKLLKNICEGISWNFGILWLADENDEYVRADYLWGEDENDVKKYQEFFNDSIKFLRGMGFPGTVFKEGKSLWTKDISRDKHFLRKEAASKMGWNSALGIPILNSKGTIAIIECFNKKSIEEKPELIEVLESAGRQIGNFMERKRAEENLRISYVELEEKVKERTNELTNALTKLIKESDEKEKIQNRIKLFAHAIRSIKDCVFITDLKLKTIFVNEAFENTYGYNIEEILAREIPILSGNNISPNLKEDIIGRTYNKGWKGELMTKRKDGSSFQTYLSTSSIRDDEGAADSIVGICQDITEIKNAEDELRKTNAILIDTQKELIYNEKLAALGRFSSGIAHEIRNPLANISSLAQLISKADVDERNKRRLNYIVSNVDIANKIIKNLLSYASPEDLDFSHFNLKDVLRNILESVEARCTENNIKIVREIPEDLTPLFLDKLKLENAFMNYISNAIDAMIDGGILTVRVSEDKSNNEIIIEIIDTGVGISSENLDKILEPFFTTKDGGVGLGMGLAYQTIRLHNGNVNIQSIEGEGTQIKIELPTKN